MTARGDYTQQRLDNISYNMPLERMITLLLAPVSYWLLYENRPGHGLPVTRELED